MEIFKKIIFVALGIIVTMSIAQAQDTRHSYGLVTEEGKVLSPIGNILGWVSKDGRIKDSTGLLIAQVDAEGHMVEVKTGKILGLTHKSGNYTPKSHQFQELGLTVLAPIYGTCEVKNANGETVLVTHESYKQYAAAAYHCLYIRKTEQIMVEK